MISWEMMASRMMSMWCHLPFPSMMHTIKVPWRACLVFNAMELQHVRIKDSEHFTMPFIVTGVVATTGGSTQACSSGNRKKTSNESRQALYSLSHNEKKYSTAIVHWYSHNEKAHIK